MSADETFELALFHYVNGRLHETEGLCRQIVGEHPGYAPALHLLGVLAQTTGHLDAAVGLIGSAIAVDASVPEYHSNLGVALAKQGRFAESASACRDALTINPELAEAHYNLGNALQGSGDLVRAAGAYRDALALRFNYPQAHNNLGNVLKGMGDLEAALAAYRDAILLEPDYAHAHSNLANALQDLGRYEEAIEAHRRALELAPETARPEIHSNLIFGLQYRAEDESPTLDEARRWNDRYAVPLRAIANPHRNDRSAERPLRIGLVSADLRMHSVAFFLIPWLEARGKRGMHFTCYPAAAKADAVSERLRAASDAWTSIAGVSDDMAAHRIREDRIDILIDLSGHTSGNRLMLFARRPAPVQVTFLGFPATTGLSAIDYRLTDAIADPPGDDTSCVERLVRLPATAWCFAPLSGTSPVAQPPAERRGHVTFGSFNNLAKASPQTLQLWARILQQTPGTKLMLKGAALRGADTRARIERIFADRGIASTRLELVPNDAAQLRHLQRYDDIDIALDTFPYHGVTTTCEALWMGVPTVSLAGRRHASRVGASLLSSVGHPEWIARSPEAYVEIAASLASDRPRLAALRASLREEMQRSALMDAPRFSGDMEAALRDMWRAWCAGAGHSPGP